MRLGQQPASTRAIWQRRGRVASLAGIGRPGHLATRPAAPPNAKKLQRARQALVRESESTAKSCGEMKNYGDESGMATQVSEIRTGFGSGDNRVFDIDCSRRRHCRLRRAILAISSRRRIEKVDGSTHAAGIPRVFAHGRCSRETTFKKHFSRRQPRVAGDSRPAAATWHRDPAWREASREMLRGESMPPSAPRRNLARPSPAARLPRDPPSRRIHVWRHDPDGLLIRRWDIW